MPGARGKTINGNGAADAVEALPAIAERRAKAAYPWRFQPGQSGNPGGLSKFYLEARKIARDAAPEMMARLIELGLTAQDERVASVCLVAGLDRAGIRPVDYDPAQDQVQPAFDPGKLTRAELEDFKALLKKMVGT
jgi:hypothetical protein